MKSSEFHLHTFPSLSHGIQTEAKGEAESKAERVVVSDPLCRRHLKSIGNYLMDVVDYSSSLVVNGFMGEQHSVTGHRAEPNISHCFSLMRLDDHMRRHSKQLTLFPVICHFTTLKYSMEHKSPARLMSKSGLVYKTAFVSNRRNVCVCEENI